MPWDFATHSKPVAQKRYICNAYETIIDSGYGEPEFTADEWLCIEAARSDKGRIQKGQIYEKVCGKYEGEMTTFRGKPELCSICDKYGLWNE